VQGEINTGWHTDHPEQPVSTARNAADGTYCGCTCKYHRRQALWFFLRYQRYINHLLTYLLTYLLTSSIIQSLMLVNDGLEHYSNNGSAVVYTWRYEGVNQRSRLSISTTPHTTTVLRPFFRDHRGEPMPEENFWTLQCKGRSTRWHTDHPAGRHSIRTNQCPPPPSPHIFYGPDALPTTQPTVSKYWRQLAHSD